MQLSAQPSAGGREGGSILFATPSIRTFRGSLLLLLIFVVPLGIASKFYSGPAQFWVRGYAGGVLYVVFWILLALVFWPTLSSRLVALTVLGITCILEVLQLWHPSALEAIRGTFIGQALIGSTFGWWDFPHYVLGAVLGMLFVRWARARASGSRQPNSAA